MACSRCWEIARRDESSAPGSTDGHAWTSVSGSGMSLRRTMRGLRILLYSRVQRPGLSDQIGTQEITCVQASNGGGTNQDRIVSGEVLLKFEKRCFSFKEFEDIFRQGSCNQP